MPEQCHFHVSRFGKFSFNGRWSGGLYLHIEVEERKELMIELVQDNTLLMTHQYDEIEANQTSPRFSRLVGAFLSVRLLAVGLPHQRD